MLWHLYLLLDSNGNDSDSISSKLLTSSIGNSNEYNLIGRNFPLFCRVYYGSCVYSMVGKVKKTTLHSKKNVEMQ